MVRRLRRCAACRRSSLAFDGPATSAVGGVVVLRVFEDRAAGVVEVEEQALVEERVAHVAVEALPVVVLHGLALLDVVPLHDVVLRPGEDSVHGELDVVIGDRG